MRQEAPWFRPVQQLDITVARVEGTVINCHCTNSISNHSASLYRCDCFRNVALQCDVMIIQYFALYLVEKMISLSTRYGVN